MANVTTTATSYPTAYSTSGSINGTKYKNAIGKGSDTASVSGNDYSSSSGSTAYISYSFAFDIPDNATIDSVACTVKGHLENTSRSTAELQMYAGSTAKGSATSFTTTSAQTLTLTTGTWSRSEIDNMTLRFTIGYYGGLVNGATVVVTYTFDAVIYTVTSTVTGDGTISPSGATEVLKDEEYTLTITPTTAGETVTATNNGTDVSASLVGHMDGETVSAVLGTYSLISGSFNGSASSYFSGIVGNGVDASTTSSNYYSSGINVQAVFRYSMSVSVPSNANIERVYAEVNGHAESSSNSQEYMCVQLVSGSTELSEQINFKSISTSNTTIELECTTLPTVSQLADMELECTLGYYGGAINGATVYVVYSVGTDYAYYTYTYTVTADATIAVTIGSASVTVVYAKTGSSTWTASAKVYVKTSSGWAEQSDLSAVFSNSENYKKG